MAISEGQWRRSDAESRDLSVCDVERAQAVRVEQAQDRRC